MHQAVEITAIKCAQTYDHYIVSDSSSSTNSVLSFPVGPQASISDDDSWYYHVSGLPSFLLQCGLYW